MKNGRLSDKEESEKTLLLHYDKHENNFPPIFSIKIIAFFISFPHPREAGAFAIDAIIVVGVLEIEIAFCRGLETLDSRRWK